MPQFDYRQEARIITTETCEFTITADTREEADRIAAAMTGYDINEDITGVTICNIFTDCNSNQLISPDQNGGKPTVGIYRGDDDKLLATNVKPRTE